MNSRYTKGGLCVATQTRRQSSVKNHGDSTQSMSHTSTPPKISGIRFEAFRHFWGSALIRQPKSGICERRGKGSRNLRPGGIPLKPIHWVTILFYACGTKLVPVKFRLISSILSLWLRKSHRRSPYRKQFGRCTRRYAHPSILQILPEPPVQDGWTRQIQTHRPCW